MARIYEHTTSVGRNAPLDPQPAAITRLEDWPRIVMAVQFQACHLCQIVQTPSAGHCEVRTLASIAPEWK